MQLKTTLNLNTLNVFIIHLEIKTSSDYFKKALKVYIRLQFMSKNQ